MILPPPSEAIKSYLTVSSNSKTFLLSIAKYTSNPHLSISMISIAKQALS
jgi:hypothetical protein